MTNKFRHLLQIKGLSAAFITDILNLAEQYRQKTTDATLTSCLQHLTVANLFFEPSTRTRTSFELAAKHLHGDTVSLNVSTSARCKGEDLLDTVRTLAAMQCQLMVIRHEDDGAAEYVANNIKDIAVINAGDGCHAHPTQALLDLFTIRHFKKSFDNLTVSIVGDIAHSRVANSLIHGLSIMGVKQIRLIGPENLLAQDKFSKFENIIFDANMESGITDSDVVVCLRIQKERMQAGDIPNGKEYFEAFGLTQKRLALAKDDAIVMHPGPINREVEIASSVADGPQSVILKQVEFGVIIRMAIMKLLAESI